MEDPSELLESLDPDIRMSNPILERRIERLEEISLINKKAIENIFEILKRLTLERLP